MTDELVPDRLFPSLLPISSNVRPRTILRPCTSPGWRRAAPACRVVPPDHRQDAHRRPRAPMGFPWEAAPLQTHRSAQGESGGALRLVQREPPPGGIAWRAQGDLASRPRVSGWRPRYPLHRRPVRRFLRRGAYLPRRAYAATGTSRPATSGWWWAWTPAPLANRRTTRARSLPGPPNRRTRRRSRRPRPRPAGNPRTRRSTRPRASSGSAARPSR